MRWRTRACAGAVFVLWLCLAGDAGEGAGFSYPMMKLKAGVNPTGIQPEILLAIAIVSQIYKEHGYDAVITSLFDGVHGEHTLHKRDGKCRAVDFRTKQLTQIDKELMIPTIKDALGDSYDVIFESLGEPNEHLHIEYDRTGI